MTAYPRRHVISGGVASALAVASGVRPAWGGARAQPAEAERISVRSGGLDIAVHRTGGTGRQVILIHGLSHSHMAWDGVVRALHPGSGTAAMDLRGHGGSSKPQGIDSYLSGRSWADDIHAVVGAVGGPPPIIVGWSLGGLAITHYLDAYGDAAVSGVVLVAAVSSSDPELLTPATGSVLAQLARPAIEDRIAGLNDFIDRNFASRPRGSVREGMLVAGAVVPTALYEAVARLAPAPPSALERVRVPALIVHGARDGLVSVEMSRRAARLIRGAELAIYERSGHGVPVDEPSRLARDIARFAGI